MQQVEEACAGIESHLKAFRADAKRVRELRECLVAIQWLRGEYRDNKTLLAPFLERIKALSREVHAAVSAARQSLSALYLESVGAVAQWEEVRESCRDALLELAATERLDRFDAPNGWLEVKQIRCLSLPGAGTPQREQLCGLITRAGRWPDVAAPNAARLLKAVDQGLFDAAQAEELARICPVRSQPRLVGHVSRKAGSGT